MFSENEVRGLERQLDGFREQSSKHHSALDELLQSHSQLLADFKSLQSDYEETKEARERYKKMARGGDHNPFVLFLVDGNHYAFDEGLVKIGAEGGVTAAQMLHAAITKQMAHLNLPRDTRIIVRIFCDLHGLSSAYHRLGVVGSHAYAMSPFTLGFARSFELFDYVDSGDGVEYTERKLRETFNLFAGNASCKHIYFAGCHNNRHGPMLQPFHGRSDRITLIRSSKFFPKYASLDLGIEQLDGVFRSLPEQGTSKTRAESSDGPVLENPATSEFKSNMAWKVRPQPEAAWSARHGSMHAVHESPAASVLSPQSSHDSPQQASSWQDNSSHKEGWQRDNRSRITAGAPICTHWIRGMCKYSDRCIKRHELPADPRGPGILESFGPKSITKSATSDNWRVPQSVQSPIQESVPPTSMHSDAEEPSNYGSGPDKSEVIRALPVPIQAVEGMIPVNYDGYRLDYYHGAFDRNDVADYENRANIIPPCIDFQLKGRCQAKTKCKADHGELEPRLLRALRLIVHQYPCKKNGTCRDEFCYNGHICYSEECHGGRRAPGCHLTSVMHTLDPNVADWVPSDEEEGAEGAPNANGGEYDLLGESFNDNDDVTNPNNETKIAMMSKWIGAQEILSPTPLARGPAPILSQPSPAISTPVQTPTVEQPAAVQDSWNPHARQNGGWVAQDNEAAGWNQHPVTQASEWDGAHNGPSGWNSTHGNTFEDGQNGQPPAADNDLPFDKDVLNSPKAPSQAGAQSSSCFSAAAKPWSPTPASKQAVASTGDKAAGGHGDSGW